MKRLLIALTALLTFSVTTNAMSYEQARQQALFLTDKMAYELNLTEEQYEAAYEINLDYLMSVNTQADLYGVYWTQRNLDLSYILLDWQYQTYLAATYFYRPLYWEAGYWHFGIYARYPHRDYFYFGRPHFWNVYRGGHSWRMNGGRSWYHGRDFGPRDRAGHGMRDRYDRGDRNFDHGRGGGSANGNGHFGNGNGRGNDNGRGYDNGRGGNPGNNGGRGADNNRNRGSRSFGTSPRRDDAPRMENGGTRTTPSREARSNSSVERSGFGGSGSSHSSAGSSSTPSRSYSTSPSGSSSTPSRSYSTSPSRSSSTPSRSYSTSPSRSSSTPSRSYSTSPSRSSSTPSRSYSTSPSRSSSPSSSSHSSGGSRSGGFSGGGHSGGGHSGGGHSGGGRGGFGGRR